MQLLLHSDRLISEVQQDFNNAYPFLKIEFFKDGYKKQARYSPRQIISRHRRLGDSWTRKREEGFLEVVDAMTVSELETAFMNEYGLNVQVFRKSGNLWLETTMTEHWTLKQQSDHAREIGISHRNSRPPDEDWKPV